jgi:protocatechuate 3,4-dioxygenase beta subunit
MKKYQNILLALIMVCLAGSCTPHQAAPSHTEIPTVLISSPTSVKPTRTCTPTLDDGVSPSYVPHAPERTVVGKGHVVTGVVLSSADCQPIAHARLEFWPEEEGLGHPDSSRATFFTDPDGRYRFECNLPDHIHMRISADGYKTMGVNSYHPNGKAEGTFDIVLQPE